MMKLSTFFTEQVWTGKGLVAWLLWPVSWLTQRWLKQQDNLFRNGKRESVHVSVPVLVVGNVLVGGTGIGYFLWNEWNNLSLSSVIFAILLIGTVGMLLDTFFGQLQKWVSYAD